MCAADVKPYSSAACSSGCQQCARVTIPIDAQGVHHGKVTMCVSMEERCARAATRVCAADVKPYSSAACSSGYIMARCLRLLPRCQHECPITEIFAERCRRRRSRCLCCCVGNAVVPASAATRVCAADKKPYSSVACSSGCQKYASATIPIDAQWG